MDKLDRLILEKRKTVVAIGEAIANYQIRLAMAKAELAAFEEAARLRPAPPPAEKGRRGRQPGAISNEWREVLQKIFKIGAVTYSQVHEIALQTGLQTDLGNVRDRVRAFVKAGLMEGTTEDGFEVTDEAADRFNFQIPTSGLDDDDDSVIEPDRRSWDELLEEARTGQPYFSDDEEEEEEDWEEEEV